MPPLPQARGEVKKSDAAYRSRGAAPPFRPPPRAQRRWGRGTMRSMVEGAFERANKSRRHCEERSDEAIHRVDERKPGIALLALAMTAPSTTLRHSRRFASAS